MMSKPAVDFSFEGNMMQATNNGQIIGNPSLLEAAFAQEKQRQFLEQQLQGQMFPNVVNPLLHHAATTANQLFLKNLVLLQQRANNFGSFNLPTTTPFRSGLDLTNHINLPPSSPLPNNGLALAAPQRSRYRDASVMPDPVVFKCNGIDKHGKRGGTVEQFPQKMHRMLSVLQKEEGGTDIASFLPHGRAFVIHNPKKFADEIMPKYFRMSRFSSFQRQLNLYDFKRIADGVDKGAYYHELFLDRRPALCTQMKRTKIKGHMAGWLTSRACGGLREKLNFYAMPPIQDAKPTAVVPVAPTIQHINDQK